MRSWAAGPISTAKETEARSKVATLGAASSPPSFIQEGLIGRLLCTSFCLGWWDTMETGRRGVDVFARGERK